MEETTRRTPDLSLRDTFLKAAASLPGEDERAGVVGEALEYLQRGFDAHYAGRGANDDDILVGDNAYALAVETIARLDEPRFVAVASRMIHDGAGRIGLDYGVYGVPETYVIDRQGVIRYKRIGPVTPEILKEKIEPLVRALNG